VYLRYGRADRGAQVSMTASTDNPAPYKSSVSQDHDPRSDVDIRERTERRIEELTAQRDELLKQIDAHRDSELAALLEERYPSTSVRLSIQRAVEEFRNFFVGYANYFWGLQSGEWFGSDQTYESVLNRALENTRGLWMQFSLAINQRCNPVYQKDLTEADSIAQDILEQSGDVVRGMPILYFEKSFQISRHPYQTYPLLGISQERFALDGRASLAHELGHHVFWNNGDLEEYAARLDAIHTEIANIVLSDDFPAVDFAHPATTRRAIQARFDQYSIWVGWIEEVFADVFGALIVGPAFAKSAQDVLIRERVGRSRDLIVDDGDHPVPALRPLIALAVLRAIAGLLDDQFRHELTALIELLEKRWQPIWAEAVAEEQGALPGQSTIARAGHSDADGGPAVTLEDLRARLGPIVNMVLTKTGFTVTANGAKQQQNLLVATKHWGKSRSEDESGAIRVMKTQLSGDPIATIAQRADRKPPGSAPAVELKDHSLFAKFLRFVDERQAALGSQDSQPGWQAVLEFELTLDQGLHGSCKDHDSSGCHKHRSDGTRVSC
jgi:hypothetical protein